MEGKGKDCKNKFHSKPRNLISTIAYHTVTSSQSDGVLKHHYPGLHSATKMRS